jgi:hypothetical protein
MPANSRWDLIRVLKVLNDEKVGEITVLQRSNCELGQLFND